VTQKFARSGGFSLSDGQYVSFPEDRCFKLLFYIVLSTLRPLGEMSLDPQSLCLAL
jgi:hypothetical protein